jgi:hypothetical protein
MKGTALIVQMIHLAANSYMIQVIKKHLLPMDFEPNCLTHPGCPQITDPERYCLTTDDQAFCRTIGDICDADGIVKAEDAYCTDT